MSPVHFTQIAADSRIEDLFAAAERRRTARKGRRTSDRAGVEGGRTSRDRRSPVLAGANCESAR
jgi:hypothetical protein